ncbi:NUDIX domain-containing protein [Candidatus Uhrbacteria bacterium]|nr:NUDIX domain-containing protein [Candidatus Uhrbacteria bacterium]
MPHLNEKIDFTVTVYIVFQNKVLLRMHDKYGIWLGPGGHIERDEDPTEAAIREVKEEVGLDVELFPTPIPVHSSIERYRELTPPRFINRHNITDIHEHVDFIFFARATSDQVIQGESEKSDECRWFSMEELDDPKNSFPQNVRVYAKTALKEVE